ncbi:hypothetical protein SLEP1_g57128 [Rubroshorea leprosula]|uniref:Myb-like domain-containing protein n=1 Tax=Rubroshorea leprosula TaxID=152421 RepID=A0AAV5MKJ5_9ROSI|nr:hypothetical protein SLEP1_g57128 [Rubroshorea leprosula]
MENELNVCSGTVYIVNIGKEGKEKVVKENLLERGPEKQGAQLSDSPDYNIDNAFSENIETTHGTQFPGLYQLANPLFIYSLLLPKKNITNPDQQPVVLDFDGEDTSDTESDEFISLTSISRRDVNTPCLEDETNVHRRTLCIPTLGKESKEEVVKEGLSEKEPERQGAQPFSDGPEYNSDKPSSQNTETAHLSQRQAEAGISGIPKEIPKEVLRQHRTNPDQQPIVLNFDGEDTSDIENDEVIKLNYSIRFRRQQRKCTYLAVPQLGRKKVPWTIEEEQMLREGVSKFSSTAGGSIPWKEILDLACDMILRSEAAPILRNVMIYLEREMGIGKRSTPPMGIRGRDYSNTQYPQILVTTTTPLNAPQQSVSFIFFLPRSITEVSFTSILTVHRIAAPSQRA